MTELDSDARRLLELVREARTPTLADKVRVEHALAQAIVGAATGSEAASSGATAVSSKSTAGMAAAKWLAGLAVPALIVGALQWRGSSLAERSELGAPRSVAPGRVVSAQVAITPSAAYSTVPMDRRSGPGPAAVTNPEVVSSRAAPRARLGHKDPAPDSLNQELDLLHAAQRAWRGGQAQQALALIERHQRQYPRSVLGLERDALRILSLCAAGRAQEAKSLARKFNGRRSPLGAAVEQSCAAE